MANDAQTEIGRLYEQLRSDMRARWQRDLPLQELLTDRWERARSLGFGDRASIYQESYVYGDVTVGEMTWIGPYTLLDGSGGLSIGSYCCISAGVHIYTHDTVKWALSGGRAEYERAPVVIEDCCYLGGQAVIAKGVRIGCHALIGANAFVNRDVADHSIVVGSPARVVGHVVVAAEGTVTLVYENDRE